MQKLKLALRHVASIPFLNAFGLLLAFALTKRDAWAVKRTAEILHRELKYYSEERNAIIASYGHQISPDKFAVPADKKEDFHRQLAELQAVEFEIFLEAPIELPDSANITPEDLAILIEAGLVKAPELTEPATPIRRLRPATPEPVTTDLVHRGPSPVDPDPIPNAPTPAPEPIPL